MSKRPFLIETPDDRVIAYAPGTVVSAMSFPATTVDPDKSTGWHKAGIEVSTINNEMTRHLFDEKSERDRVYSDLVIWMETD